MNTPADTQHPTPSPAGHAADGSLRRPPATRRFTTAGLVALGAVLLAVIWAAAALWPLSGQVDELGRGRSDSGGGGGVPTGPPPHPGGG